MNSPSGGNFPVINIANTNGTWTFFGNTYTEIAPNVTKFYWTNLIYTLPQWQALGFDSDAVTNNVAADAVRVYPNQDTAKRAHIAVYNWSLANNVSVNLSGVLNAGDTYQLYNAQDYGSGVIKTGSFSGSTISVPMTNLTTSVQLPAVTNWGLIQPSPVSPEFGAFVVLGQSTNLPAPVTTTARMNVGTAIFR